MGLNLSRYQVRPALLVVLLASAGRSSVHGQQSNSCPLTPSQELAAVKAFNGFVPVFREPRCMNCHGAINPFAEDGGHPITIDISEEARDLLQREDLQDFLRQTGFDEKSRQSQIAETRQLAESQQPMTDRDLIRQKANLPMREACQRCHIKDWIIPMSQNYFVGRSDRALCAHLKTSELTTPADIFLQHMQSDLLILAGFRGTRGLLSGVTPQPPGMPFATLEKYVNEWVDAMGGKFVGSPECGCLKPIMELKMTSEWTGRVKGTGWIERVSATVPLDPDGSGLVFRGKSPYRPGDYTITPPPGFPCRLVLKPLSGELEVTEARFEVGADQRMSISLAVIPTMNIGTISFKCPRPYPGPPVPALNWSGYWQALHRDNLIKPSGYHFDEFEAASGLSLRGGRKLVGRKEVTRRKAFGDVSMTAKTTFEFWWVGQETGQ